MEQVNLGFFTLWECPKEVSQEVIRSFEGSTHKAIKWSFDHRTDPNGKPIAWLAKQLGMRRSTLSRMINHGDFKLDPAKVHLWDFLVGTKAVSQLVESEKTKLIDAISQTQLESIKLIMERNAA